MAQSIVSVHYVGGPNEPWVVKSGRKVIGTHFTHDAAALTMRRELDRIGVRFVDPTPEPEPDPPQRLVQVVFERKTKGDSDPYTYALPEGMEVEVGQHIYVPVPFGSEDREARVTAIGNRDYDGYAEVIWDPNASLNTR